MSNQNWSEIGNRISDLVQDAIDSQDYSKVSQMIQNAVSTAVSSAAEGVVQGMAGKKEPAPREAKKAVKAQNPWKGNGQFEKKTKEHMLAEDLSDTELYSAGGATRLGGYALTGIGAAGCIGSGLLMLIPAVIGMLAGSVPLAAVFGVQGPLLLLSIAALWKGTSILGRIRRFQNYVRALGTRTCISVKELAGSVGKEEKATLKDVRRMIERGMFRQGHLDLSGKNLFVTDHGYEAYLSDQKRMEERRTAQLAEQKERDAYKTNDALSDEVRQLIEEGRGYIDRIHASNEAIQDEVVSAKLDGLETVITRIFQYVEKHPESAPETKKLMKYYLPTTIKLLESYQKLNGQPVQGPNILKSKTEIENTLDTLNQAFARLFDNLYQDTSVDIFADISVLNTLLAQEGLTGQKIKE